MKYEMNKVSKISIIRIYDEGEKFVDLQGEGEISVRTCLNMVGRCKWSLVQSEEEKQFLIMVNENKIEKLALFS